MVNDLIGIMIISHCVWKWLVPLNPMVLLIIIPIKWLFHWEYTLFSDKPIKTHLKPNRLNRHSERRQCDCHCLFNLFSSHTKFFPETGHAGHDASDPCRGWNEVTLGRSPSLSEVEFKAAAKIEHNIKGWHTVAYRVYLHLIYVVISLQPLLLGQSHLDPHCHRSYVSSEKEMREDFYAALKAFFSMHPEYKRTLNMLRGTLWTNDTSRSHHNINII